MKSIIFVVSILLSSFAFSQKITLTGKVPQHLISSKLYYSFNLKSFNKTQSISINKDCSYTWAHNLKKLNKDSIVTISFSTNLGEDPSNEYSCSHTIHLNKIFLLKGIKKSYTIETDLNPSYYCEATSCDYANSFEKKHIVGKYSITGKDTKSIIKLSENCGFYTSIADKVDKKLYNKEVGHWKYNNDTLSFQVWRLRNDDIGLLKSEQRSYTFSTEIMNGKMLFYSDKYKLIKQ